jgi:hypothetical protein
MGEPKAAEGASAISSIKYRPPLELFLPALFQDFTSSKDAQSAMDEDLLPVVLGPTESSSASVGLYITDDHHTLSALDFRFIFFSPHSTMKHSQRTNILPVANKGSLSRWSCSVIGAERVRLTFGLR